MSQYHRPATARDAWNVAMNLRPADAHECYAASGTLPSDVLMQGVCEYGAEAVVAPDGEVIALCGVVATPTPGVGSVWMVGTKAISRHRTRFLREGRKWLDVKFSDYRCLGNFVDARNELHIRWLKHLGFTFADPIPYGPFGLPFIPFYKVG